jgi:4'-phosphopantetheinyl transferase
MSLPNTDEIHGANATIAIDWHPYPACGLSRAVAGLTLAFVPIRTFQARYLPGMPFDPDAGARPLTLVAASFSAPLLAAAEIKKVNTFKSRKRQLEWMAGRLAAKTLAADTADQAGPLPDTIIAYHPEGAPYVDHQPRRSLSISHAGGYAVAGLARSDQTALGLDIEKMQALDIESILPVAFSDRERRRLDPADRYRFFECWTLKEAYLKYLGRGFRENLKAIEILEGTTIRHAGQIVAGLQVRTFQPFPGYTLAIVFGPTP